LCLGEGRLQEAVEILRRGRAVFPDDEYLGYLEAEAFYELDDYDSANRLLLEIVNAPPARHYHAGGLDNIQGQVAPRSLGEVLRIRRQFAAAERVLQTVVERYPGDAIAWHALGRVYIDRRCREKLDEVRERLAHLPRGRLLSPLLLASWHMLHGDWKAAERLLDELIAQAPQMPLLRLMRAELLNRRGAGLAACLQAYRDVLRVSPGNAAAAAMVERLEGSLHRPATVGALNLCTAASMAATGSIP
jgi:tetratricopeptide (TPR) repeat protein